MSHYLPLLSDVQCNHSGDLLNLLLSENKTILLIYKQNLHRYKGLHMCVLSLCSALIQSMMYKLINVSIQRFTVDSQNSGFHYLLI